MSNRKRTSRGASNQKPTNPPASARKDAANDAESDADPEDEANSAAEPSGERSKRPERSDRADRADGTERGERSSGAKPSGTKPSGTPRSSNASKSSASRRSSGAAKSRGGDDETSESRPAARPSTSKRSAGDRSAPAKRSAASGGSRSTRSNNGRRSADRAEGENPRLPAADSGERRTPRSASNRGPEDAPARQRRSREDARDGAAGGSRRPARPAPAPEPSTNGRVPASQREFGGGFDVITVEPDHSSGRHRPLEALWFELAGAWGPDGIGPVALVAVPEMTAEDAAHFALRLAEVGAEIGGRSIRLITALDIGPSDAELLAEMATGSELTMLVVQSPTADPAAIPLLRRCTSVVPVVQLGSSLEDEVDQLVDSLGASRVPTVLAVDPAPKRRRFGRNPSKRSARGSGKKAKQSARSSKKRKKQRAEVSA